MPRTATAGYDVERAKLATAPRYFIRPAHTPYYGSGTDYPFSVDFSTGDVGGATKTKYPWLFNPSGNTQIIEAELGRSSIGTMTFRLLDKGGEVLKYLSNPALTLNGAHNNAVTTITVNESTAGYPAVGTVEITTTGTVERVRYTGKTALSFTGCTRGVDGSAAAAHSNLDAVANGEQLRAGNRIQLYCGYAPLLETDYMSFVKMEIIRVTMLPDRVTFELVCQDIQRSLRRQIFLTATPDAPVALTGHPIDLALQILTSTGFGSNGAYDVLTADKGLAVPSAMIDVTTIAALKAAEFAGQVYTFSITGPQDGKTFLEEQFWKTLNCYPVVNQSGQLSVKRYKVAVSAPSVSLTQDDIIAAAWMRADEQIINVVKVNYDFNITGAAGIFGTRQTYEKGTLSDSTMSIGKYGRRTPLVLNALGWRTADGAQAIADDRALEVIRRYAEPQSIVQVDCFYRNHKMEPGDQITLTDARLPNPRTGLRGFTAEVFEILDVAPQFGSEGKLRLTLLWVAAIATQTAPTAGGAYNTTSPLVGFETLGLDEGIKLSGMAERFSVVTGAGTPRTAYRIVTGYQLNGAFLMATGDIFEYGIWIHSGSLDTRAGMDFAIIERAGATVGTGGHDATHIKLDAGSSAVDDYYNGMIIQLAVGANPLQYRTILDYVGATRIAQVGALVNNAVDATSTFNMFDLLRNPARAVVDQNGVPAICSTQLGSAALGRWYVRRFTVPAVWNAKSFLHIAVGMDTLAGNTTAWYIQPRLLTSGGALRYNFIRYSFTDLDTLWSFGPGPSSELDQNITSAAARLESGVAPGDAPG